MAGRIPIYRRVGDVLRMRPGKADRGICTRSQLAATKGQLFNRQFLRAGLTSQMTHYFANDSL
jgi:hypothetical protein